VLGAHEVGKKGGRRLGRRGERSRKAPSPKYPTQRPLHLALAEGV
jgi:hypothetical protein